MPPGEPAANPGALAAGDLNGDGRTDLVVADPNHFGVSVLLGLDGGGFGPPISVDVGGQTSAVVIGDFNGDRIPDLVTANDGSIDDLWMVLGRGDGGFGAPIDVGNPGGYADLDLASADFNRDGHPDLATAVMELSAGGGAVEGRVSVFYGQADGGFSGPHSYLCGGLDPVGIAVGDFNGDGWPDIASLNQGANATGGGVGLLLGLGDGGFASVHAYVSTNPGFFISGAVADFNGDGVSDLAVVQGPLTLFLGGDGGFTAMPTALSPMAPLAAGDFNGDGVPDLAGSGVSIYLGRGDGTFHAALGPYPAGVNPAAMVAGPFGGDGGDDLAVLDQGSFTNQADAGVTVLRHVGCP